MNFPSLSGDDLGRVAQTILELFDPRTASDPARAKQLQADLHNIQSSTEAWGLISGLSGHEDANVRFFSAHTAQVKISRDWNTLPDQLQPALLSLLLETLSAALSTLNHLSYQPGNAVVIRKIFGSIASLLLRLPFYHFPNPVLTVLQTIQGSAAAATRLPPSAPASGFNTPGGPSLNPGVEDVARIRHKMRLWGLEWCGICVEEIGRAGISDQKKKALQRHIEGDMPAVMAAITEAMAVDGILGSPDRQAEKLREAEAACKCAESWVGYGISGDDLLILLPALYRLLPLPAASATITEILTESVFRFGKGTRALTEPLIEWTITLGQPIIDNDDLDATNEVIGITKMLCGLVEHSSEWLVARIAQPNVQAFLGMILRLTGWGEVAGVDENISELTLATYPLIQEAIMDSPLFQAPHETSPDWQIAKQFFSQLVNVIRTKVRYPGQGGKVSMAKDSREVFDTWRRDAGEVIVCAFYILRDEMLGELTRLASTQIDAHAPWQDIEATLHCISFSSEAVPLGEETYLPVIFGQLLQKLALRDATELRLRRSIVGLIAAYEEWFKFHPDHLLPCLNYLVVSLSTPSTAPLAANTLKSLCDMCRKKLVEHIGAFSDLHSKIGALGADEQVKVIQAITSVIQALSPEEAIGPIEGIATPILDQVDSTIQAMRNDPSAPSALVQNIESLAACFKGLAPSEDDIFDADEDSREKDEKVRAVRHDPRLVRLRQRAEGSITGVVVVWTGDGEVADAISSLVKHSTLAETLISLSPLPLISLVCAAAERSPSALWLSLASTLTLRINSPPSPLTVKKDKSPEEEQQHAADEQERWNIVADAAQRLAVVAGRFLSVPGGMSEHPDVVEAFFKFSSALSSRFPGVLLRLPTQTVEAYMQLGIMGLSAQERFSLTTATGFFIALFTNTRYPSPLEPIADSLIKHFGPRILRALLLSAGAEGPRSVIPNLAELLASLVTRVPGLEMAQWLKEILAEEGFPDRRATQEAKSRLQMEILKSRTAKKMRVALHDFALVSRGLDNTTYGNATAI